MGIDGIGKSGGAPPLDGASAGRSTSKSTDAEFRVERTGAAPSSDLQRLERNEISHDEYVQLRVDQATSHLHGHLSPERLDELKQQLRAQLEVDPMLQRLLQRATGVAGSADAGDGS